MRTRRRPQSASLASPDRPAVKARAALAAALAVAVVVARFVAEPPEDARRWTFDGRAQLPASYGFDTPNVSAGAWRVTSDAGAANQRALVNDAGDGGPAALAIVRGSDARDARLRTRCRGTCGVVFRLRDVETYYVARVDAATLEAVLAVVEAGRERDVARTALDDGRAWRELDVRVVRDHIVFAVDGRTAIDVRDMSLRSPGARGLWAPALDSASFDVLSLADAALASR